MSVLTPVAYDELISYLAELATPQQILDFVISADAQTRAIELMERNQDDQLTLDERVELEQMLHFDRLVSALKAQALEKLSQP